MSRSRKEREERRRRTIKRMLRNLSWALVIVKARSGLEEISRLWSFLTLFRNALVGVLFLAITRRPEQGRGVADILLPSIALAYRTMAMKRTSSPVPYEDATLLWSLSLSQTQILLPEFHASNSEFRLNPSETVKIIEIFSPSLY